MIIAEAIRNAQKLTGKKVITGEDMRRGLETLNITAARWKEIGARRLRRADARSPAPITTATTPAYMQHGTAPSGSRSPTGSQPMKDKVMPLLDAAAKDYVDKNAGWPKRTEACDKSS